MSTEKLEPLGQPVEEPSPEGEHDFAGEHDATAVDKDITDGKGVGESESPEGWSGLDRDGPP